MHRNIAATIPPEHTEWLIRKLKDERFVMSLTLERGAGIDSRGDVVTVSCLNRGTDQVLNLMEELQKRGAKITVVTSRADSISKTGQQHLIDGDIDEGIWEEMESGLVHHARLTINYVLLMAFGGAIAAAGLYSDTVGKTMALVAASIIAPGYEPIVKIPLSLVLRRWSIFRQALLSVSVGYAVLIVFAALTFGVLNVAGAGHLAALGSVPEARSETMFGIDPLIVSACSAAAGAVMIASFRETVLAGPLIGLTLVTVATILGAAITAHETGLALQAVRRLSTDMGLVVVLGYAVFWLKQKLRHKRKPLV